MLGHRELTKADYLAITKRRLPLIGVCAVLTLILGVAVTYVIPPQYISQTLVIIEQQKVPTNYVSPVVNEDLAARLASMKEQILSRSQIEPIIQRFNLFPDRTLTIDERIELTQKAIVMKPIPAVSGTRGTPGFYITFTARDPHTAQQVCGEVTSLFVSENLHAREESAEGTTDFLKQQLADSKKNLDDQDAKLADFERKYLGKLPGQEKSNESTLQALTGQLDAATQSIDRLQQNETFLQAMIIQQEKDLQTSDPSGSPTTDDRRKQLQDLIEQKRQLDAIYTPDHPDVVSVSRKISELQAEINRKPESGAKVQAAAPPHTETPQLQQQKAQLHAVQQSIATAKHGQDQIEQQIRAYEARIDMSPVVEEEYEQVTRDHETALQFYNSLLRKMNESSMATALEQRQEGEQFRVMDAPNLPDAPRFPNRLVFAAGGLVFGLILGTVLGLLLEYRDETIRCEMDVYVFTKLPTLAVVPHVDGLPKSRSDDRIPRKLFLFRQKPIQNTGG